MMPGSAKPPYPTPWRVACERALLDFTRPDALRFWGRGIGENGYGQPPFDYRFEHTLAVVKLACWLAPQVGADTDILLCAAWLHDCRKKLGELGADTHAADAAGALCGILAGTDFPLGKISDVRHAILNHVGLHLQTPLEPLETACLWDIDKLSKLGVAGLVHSLGISTAFGPISTAAVLERGEKWLDLAYGIAGSMNTAPAKSEAAGRLDYLRQFYERLKSEWGTVGQP